MAKRRRTKSKAEKPLVTETCRESRREGVLLNVAIPILISVVTLAVFSPVLDAGFVNWDDDANFLENPNYRGLGWPQLRWMFTTFYGGHYQPLAWVTFGLDYWLWGMNPFGYHLTNLILHVANALLVYFLALRLLNTVFPSLTADRDLWLSISAGLTALLFALHPLRVESVAWATERRDVLSGFFIFSSVLCYLRAVQLPSPERIRWMAVALGLFALSLLSKAIGITLPAVLLILDLYPLKRLYDPNKNGLLAMRRDVLLEKVPFVLLALSSALVAVTAQGGVMRTLSDHGLGARIAQAVFGLAFYLWKTLVPLGLSPIYEMPENFNPLEWRFLVSGFLVVGITISLFVLRRRWPAGLSAWLCYGFVLAPVLGVAQSGPQMVADRYSYLSCLSWAVLGGAGFYYFSQSRLIYSAILRSFVTGGVITVLAILGMLTWQQAQIWQSSERLWRHALSVTENTHFRASVAHNNLGVVLMLQGQLDDAIQHFRRSLAINPVSSDAYNNLGHSFFRKTQWSESAKYYRQAIQIDPSDAQAYYNLGNALTRNNRPDEALRAYRESARLNSTDARPHYNIGTILARRNELDDAVRSFREAIRLDPNYGLALTSLGTALAISGQLDEAKSQFSRALNIDPQNVTAHQVLANIFAMQGNHQAAEQHQQAALRLMAMRAQTEALP
jgi:protein O-mannosyl-transferase